VRPGGAPIGGAGEADVARPAPEHAPDLEGTDDRRPAGERVGLDLGRVLAGGSGEGIAADLACVELIVPPEATPSADIRADNPRACHRPSSWRTVVPIHRSMSINPAPPTAPLITDQRVAPRGLVPPSRRGRSRRLLGDVIVDLGFASREAVDQAVARAREFCQPTGQVLLESGAIRQTHLARALGERLGIDYIDLSVYEIDMGAVNLLPVEAAKRYMAVPVGFLTDRRLVLAMADPTNIVALDEISMITGMEASPASAAEADIIALISRLGQFEESVGELEITEPQPEPETEIALRDGGETAPAIKLVHSIIAQAIEQGASDIHWNPETNEMQVKYRIDGIPSHAATITRAMAVSVVSRIKIMANLDIAERRISQDGRLTLSIDGRRVDVRVVTLPLINGEGIVMRILDTQAVVRDLSALGMHGSARERFVTAVTRPYGAVLVTGPTGSGKSTTLYSALDIINDGERSILTIEDPVESSLVGIKQMQVSHKAGVTFATGLRSILRADPDVIMVGEIRDRETAQIAIQSALTGHLVLSTLHTRDAASAITRLVDMGIEPFLVAAAIDCVVAQRLARTLCVHCKRPSELPAGVRDEHGLLEAEVFEPAGCIRCGWTGYHGRVALYEVMPVTDEVRSLTLDQKGHDDILAAAIRLGMGTMAEDGLEKVKQGLTSLVEVSRVTATL
jgi:type IV pilus assembly protein PilB